MKEYTESKLFGRQAFIAEDGGIVRKVAETRDGRIRFTVTQDGKQVKAGWSATFSAGKQAATKAAKEIQTAEVA